MDRRTLTVVPVLVCSHHILCFREGCGFPVCCSPSAEALRLHLVGSDGRWERGGCSGAMAQRNDGRALTTCALRADTVVGCPNGASTAPNLTLVLHGPAKRRQRYEADQGCGAEIEAHGDQAAAVGQELGDQGGEAAAQNAADIEGHRGAGVADARREQARQEGAQRP